MFEITFFDDQLEVGTEYMDGVPVAGEKIEVFGYKARAIAVRDLGDGCYEVDVEYV